MNSEAKVGLMVIIFFLFIGFFSFKIGGDRMPWDDDGGSTIYVKFDSIEGLGAKSKVRYAGVEVGYVEEIALDKGKARVTLRLDPDIIIRGNARFIVASMGLMGEKYVSISGGTERAEVLSSDSIVQGDSAVSMDQLLASLNVIGNDIGAITAAIKSAIGTDGDHNKLTSILENIEKLSSNLSNVADENDETLAQTLENFRLISEEFRLMVMANQRNVDSTMTDIRIAAESLASSMPSITSDFQRVLEELRIALEKNSKSVDATIENVESASSGLDSSMGDLSSIMNKVDSGRGTLGKLINQDRVHENLNDALVEVKDAAKEIRSCVGRVSDYRVCVGYRGEYLQDSQEWKNYVSLRVQPRPDKFYLFEMVNLPRGNPQKEEFFYEFQQAPDFVNDTNTIHYTKTTWNLDESVYSLQFGKIYHRLTIRGGLIENTGGFGADLNLYKKKLWLSIDGWDFNRDLDPHLKITGRYNFGDSLYITGGWDDFLLEDQQMDNFFFGAGLRFEDVDLKYLLGFLPVVGK